MNGNGVDGRWMVFHNCLGLQYVFNLCYLHVIDFFYKVDFFVQGAGAAYFTQFHCVLTPN